ncbi:MAG: ROK family protein [Sphingomonas sp.]
MATASRPLAATAPAIAAVSGAVAEAEGGRRPGVTDGMSDTMLLGVELGGTKCIAVASRGQEIVREARWPTTTPEITLTQLFDTIAQWQADQAFAALGLASFGPLHLGTGDPRYGCIGNTPKQLWAGVDLMARARAHFSGPIALDTDVNAAALAEGHWGAAKGLAHHAYITIGTGVGVGLMLGGRAHHGTSHAEIGHLRVRRAGGDGFAGNCPFHGDCLEGLVSGPALERRTGLPGQDIPDDHPVWQQVAAEIAQLIVVLILTVAVERIVIGGSVAVNRPALLPAIRAAALAQLAGYPRHFAAEIDTMVTLPALGDRAGPLGAIAVAMSALEAEGR